MLWPEDFPQLHLCLPPTEISRAQYPLSLEKATVRISEMDPGHVGTFEEIWFGDRNGSFFTRP